MAKSFLLASAATVILATGGMASAETLSDAIALAYRSNPALLAARADQRARDEVYIQARDALGPSVGLSEQHSREDALVKQSSFGFTDKSFNRATTDTLQLSISQPLYSGGVLATAIDAAHAEVLGGREGLRQQEQLVLGQVITAYADVLLAQDLVAISRQDVEILRRQTTETQARVEAKDVTLTDGAQARARLIAAELHLTQTRDQLSNAQTKYRAVVGQAPGQLEPLPDLPGIPPGLDEALTAADRGNPQVLEAAYTEAAARARVAEAKAADGLQVGLTASASSGPVAPYLSHQSVNSVMGAIVVQKPLFTAGLHSSRVRQAIETHDRDDLRLADDRRQLVASVVQAWNDLATQRQVLISLNEQLGEEDKAFEGSRIESRIGLRTTIDVLNAEQEYQATKVSLAQAYHDEYLTRVGLMANIGVLRAELLYPEIKPYEPQASLARHETLNKVLAWEAVVQTLDGLGASRPSGGRAGRDPLGDQAPVAGAPLPATPRWSDLDKYLTEQPTTN